MIMKKILITLLLCTSIALTGCTSSNVSVEKGTVTTPDFVTSTTENSSSISNQANNEAYETGGTTVEAAVNNSTFQGQTVIGNPSWHKFYNGTDNADNYPHISLTKTSEESYDWLDSEVWCEKNGFEYASLPYKDDVYRYEVAYLFDNYSATELLIYSVYTGELLYDLDLYLLCYGPDDNDEYSTYIQDIQYTKIDDTGNTLYVSIIYNGYSSDEPVSNHIIAINLQTMEVIWRSEPLVSGLSNFLIVDDTIICGYGFTSEPDYIYLLDKHTGDKIEQISVASAPEQFAIKNDTLYVATYNTSYEFKIQR